MVIFFFSGAWAAAPVTNAMPSASAASAWMSRFMFFPPSLWSASRFPRRRVELERLSRLHHLAGDIVADDHRDAARDGEELRQVDAGVVAHVLQHVHEVLGADVARGAGGEGTAAQAGHGAVEGAHPRLDAGHHVREPHAARVVEMERVVG